MSLIGFFWATLSAVSWGGLDALRKILSARIDPIPLSALLTLGQLPVFGAWVWLSTEPRLLTEYWIVGLPDAFCALLASVLFFNALRVSPLSVSIPMLALTPVFALLVAGLLLGEVPSHQQLFGVAVVVFGALILNRPKTPEGIWFSEPGVWMMIGVAFLWATTLTLDKLAQQQASTSIHALLQAALISAGLVGWLVLRGELSALRAGGRQLPLLLPAIALYCTATVAQLFAVQVLLVGLVEAIKRALGFVMAVINGRLLFEEPITRQKIVAIVLLAIGVTALQV